MIFSILLPRLPLEHSQCFAEVADCLKEALGQLGMDVPIVDTLAKANGPTLVLAPQLLHLLKEELPDDLILYNFEQLYQGCRWFNDFYRYQALLKTYPVWDYSDHNIQQSKKLGLCDPIKCELGYMPTLTRLPQTKEKDVDFLLFGRKGPRRSRILEELTRRGYNVQLLTNMYDKERDEWIARSKIHLNIHYYDAHIFEIVRVSYLLANQQFVISERGNDKALEQPFEEGVAFTSYDKMLETCEHFIRQTNARENIAEKGFRTMSARSQATFLEEALREHAKRNTIEILPTESKQQKTIFIAIPSYKDPECIHTVLSIFEKADHPHRIRVGVCWQTDEQLGDFPYEKLGRWKDQLQVISYNVSQSHGANWARNQAYSFYQGEDHTLLIDAHMHFLEGWDSFLLKEYEACGEDDAVLTFYCPPYDPGQKITPNMLVNRRVTIRSFGEEGDPQLLHLFRSNIEPHDFRHGMRYPTPFVVHHFIFSKGDLFKRLPLDPNIYFWGDEVTLSARLWTHGINIYQLPHLAALHQWNERDAYSKRNYRNLNNTRSDASSKRVRHMLHFERAGDMQIEAEYDLGSKRSLESFWQFAGVDIKNQKISNASIDGKWNLQTKFDQASERFPTIFVSIASYRDPECQHTIRDLFEKALYPGRVFVGVCWQLDKKADVHCRSIDYQRNGQLREVVYDWQESEGVCWARAKSHALMQGEDYFLQIDSHSRFAKGWDEQLIQMHQRLGKEKAVLSAVPARYTPPHNLEKKAVPNIQRAVPFNRDRQLRFLGARLPYPPQNPIPGAFISAAFMFGPAQLLREVPYDPYLYFDQEEICYSLRLYTHGWDIFSPHKVLLYHYYLPHGDEKHSHWGNVIDTGKMEIFTRLAQRGMKRFDYLTGMGQFAGRQVLKDIDQYGLGSSRSLQDFEQFTGIDFKRRTVSDKGLKAEFIPEIREYAGGEVAIETAEYHARMQEKELVGARNNAKKRDTTLQSPQAWASPSMEKLVCIATSDAGALTRSLQSIFQQAVRPDKISVSVAWTGRESFSIPSALENYVTQITMRLVAPGGTRAHLSLLHEALAAWNQQPHIVALRAGVQLTTGWDALLSDAFAAIHDTGVITQIAATSAMENANRISALPSMVDDHYLISVGHAPENKPNTKVRELELTPLVSFDMLAASAATWFKLLPDPYLTQALEDVVYSARLWTHGVSAYQVNQLLVWNKHPMEAAAAANELAFTRAKHMLGLAYAEDDSALFELDKYGHGEHSTIDAFWQAVGVDISRSHMHPLARSGDWSALAGLKLAKKKNAMQSFADTKEKSGEVDSTARIFVQIASYRDVQCQYTVQDLFEKATYPDRISVGICWQTIPEEDEDCFRIITRPEQVRMVHFSARESKGACWARHHTQKLWQGEEYTLQIDSHMRFEKGWDVMLLNMQKQLNNPKSVLTTYPAGFTPPAKFTPKAANMLVAKEFIKEGIFTMGSKRIKTAEAQGPVPGAFISACFLFGPSSIIQDVPYDPYLYFFGEEISLSARLWTHDYDIYHPHKHLAWHDWKRDNRKTTHFKDHKNWGELNQKSFARVKYLLSGVEPVKKEVKQYVVQEMGAYGLGPVRSLEEYEQFAGIGFKNRHISERAKKGIFEIEKIKGVKPAAPVNPAVKATVITGEIERETVAPYMNPIKPVVKPKSLIVPDRSITLSNHTPVKTFESREVIVYDNFLPGSDYERLYQYSVNTDYRHINTTGNVNRVWALDNGFPLRSDWDYYYEATSQKVKPAAARYPVNKPSDQFMEHVNAIMPDVQHMIGAPGVNWAHYSVTCWLYPPNTGLSLHNDGATYTGAYVYFLNKEWRIHWGGLLMVLDQQANEAIETHKKEYNGHKFHRGKWLHESEHNDYAMEVGFARTIFPKKNRIVFIAPDAYHIVTKVLPAAGDNIRMTFAGFFNRGILSNSKNKQKA